MEPENSNAFGLPVRGRYLAIAAALLAAVVAAVVVISISSSSADSHPATVAQHQTTSPQPPTSTAQRPPPRHPSVHLPAGATVLKLPQSDWTHVVPAGFLGVGIEYKTLFRYEGRNADNVDPVFEELIRNLSPAEPPQVRIGGDTTDWSWWPVPGAVRPRGVSFVLTPHWISIARAFEQAVHARLMMGINFEADSVPVAVTESQQLLSRMGKGSIEALELGNEPELLSIFGWYRTPFGKEVPGRPSNYNFATFRREWVRIAHTMPNVPIAGPSLGGPRWFNTLGPFLADNQLVRIATVHRYPLFNCLHSNSPLYPSVSHLLSARASYGLAQSTLPWIRIAHADHLPIRVDEMNSTPCPGAAAVLRTFAESLWTLRVLFEMANAGADGVNVQTTAAATDDMFIPSDKTGTWEAAVQPEYYGMLMFGQAVPPGARMVALSRSSTAQIQAWATQASDGTIRVLLMNLGGGQHTVAVNAGAASAPGTLERLEGSSLTTKYGITLGGQTFGSETSTGRMSGRRQTFTIKPGGGDYVVTLPALSAAMLTIAAPAHA
jgi:hypothetical protein